MKYELLQRITAMQIIFYSKFVKAQCGKSEWREKKGMIRCGKFRIQKSRIELITKIGIKVLDERRSHCPPSSAVFMRFASRAKPTIERAHEYASKPLSSKCIESIWMFNGIDNNANVDTKTRPFDTILQIIFFTFQGVSSSGAVAKCMDFYWADVGKIVEEICHFSGIQSDNFP